MSKATSSTAVSEFSQVYSMFRWAMSCFMFAASILTVVVFMAVWVLFEVADVKDSQRVRAEKLHNLEVDITALQQAFERRGQRIDELQSRVDRVIDHAANRDKP